jgi:hypothetical protein
MVTQYSVLGTFIDSSNPYALVSAPPVDPNAPGTGIIAATTAANPGVSQNWPVVYGAPPLFWPFRLPVEDRVKWPSWVRPWEAGPTNWAGGGPSLRRKRVEVNPYEVVKAICVPYAYTRVVAELSGSPHFVPMKSHILIGYTAPRPDPDGLTAVTMRSVFPPGVALIAGYTELGEFIELQHPVKTGELGLLPANTQLVVDLNNPMPPLVQLAISWLEHDSKLKKVLDQAAHASDPPDMTEVFLPSSADEEMDLHQEQECLSWVFPQRERRLDGTYPGPTDMSATYPEYTWMRLYQITKAISVRYTVAGGEKDGQIGDILIGYSGSGDC